MEGKNNENKKHLNDFQIRNLRIIAQLMQQDAVTEDIIELLWESEIDYFSLVEKNKLLEEKINIDEKTNLLKFNKNYLTNIIKTASRVFDGMREIRYNVSFVRFDIDDFSIFNNKYGHELGDEVLIKIAKTLKENSRPTDYVIRYGGEEFDVILPSTNIEKAIIYLDKIFEKINDLNVRYNNEVLTITISGGASYFAFNFGEKIQIKSPDIENSFKRLQNEADDALYEAKFLGKNRYCIYSKDKENEYPHIRERYINLT